MKAARYICLVISAQLILSCNEKPIDFSSQVKPIINKRCISCHGGVKRNNGFSLLFRQDALDTTESGKPAIIPGDVENSEFIKRITHHDPEERMPYKENPLPHDEIKILTQWIKEGAKWGDHWAYTPPKEVEVPGGGVIDARLPDGQGFFSSNSFVKNNIDRFVQQKLDEVNLKPNEQADPETLLRRVYLDIIGIPPTPEQAAEYLSNPNDEAYEKMVDGLLASPRYGEKWASWWLDMARYADTKGYEKDASRVIWRYRDWVIKSLNKDMPFDQFTIEQLAGDLLPNPTEDQYVATGFHRNAMNNDEGGTDDEEFRIATVIDRVNTTYSVWQSTTFGCIQCHSHPYDPFRHEEYYKSFAFFNNTRDEDTEGDYPKFRFYEKEDSIKVGELVSWFKNQDAQKANTIELFLKTLEPKIHAHACDEYENGALVDTKWMGIRNGGHCRTKGIDLTDKDFLLINYSSDNNAGKFELRVDDLNGELLASGMINKTKGWKVMMLPIKKFKGARNIYWKFYNSSLAPGNSVCFVEWFSFIPALPGEGKFGYDSAVQQFQKLINTKVPATPIMVENKAEQHRSTYVFERGNWMVKGEKVEPQTPRSLGLIPEENPNRLSLAKWLISPNNPLTSRTITNRIWEQIFGNGIVESIEDFGTQGDLPSHPELLDYLALRLSNDYKWSIKKLIKEIVLSGTYRQSSSIKNWEADPTNKWLSHGPRFRLTAEQVRDQALLVSGLLSDKMYGPGVMPYQPDRVWQSVYNGDRWTVSEGEDRFRRALYTFIKRTSVYPSVMIFDGSSREVCLGQRVRTNTPLQALVTLNDPVYVEAARVFASNVKSKKAIDQIREAYKVAMLNDISDEKLIPLFELYIKSLENYLKDGEAVKQIMGCDSDDAHQAALTVTCLAIFNLDEFLTKG